MGKSQATNAKAKANNAAEITSTFSQIQESHAGIILGKQVNMRGNQHKAIKHRIQKEKRTWAITKQTIQEP